MWEWATNTGNRWLFEDGWVVRRIDTTPVSRWTFHSQMRPVAPSTWAVLDAFVEASFTANASGLAAENRRVVRAMVEAGCAAHQEWWHFEWPMPAAERCDVPYGRTEPAGRLWCPDAQSTVTVMLAVWATGHLRRMTRSPRPTLLR